MSCFFQFAGTRHEIPCSSHLTSCPLAIAAICADVGFGFSTGSPPMLVGLPDEDEEELELPPPLNLFVKLHAATTSAIRTINGICFIRITMSSIKIQKRNGLLLQACAAVNE